MNARQTMTTPWFWAVVALSVNNLAYVPVLAGQDHELNLSIQVQFWNILAHDFVNAAGQKVDTRSDLYIRRGRLGLDGRLRQEISYKLTFAYDNVGKNGYNGATGSAQSQDNRDFYLWDSFLTWQLDRTWANLSLGYFRPQVGRESITSFFEVNSFAKSLANFYPREHIVGRSTGRETGVNLGGFRHGPSWGWNYNLGFFDPNHEKIVGEGDGGVRWSPLWTGRVAITIGDPEMARYGTSYRTNYNCRRAGVTMAFNGTHQGETNEMLDADTSAYRGGFRRNNLWGIDLLANYGPLNLSAEHDWLRRQFTRGFVAASADLNETEYTDRVWHVRLGYNLPLTEGRLLEPSVMLSCFEADAHSALYPGGRHQVMQWSLQWYQADNDLILKLSYTDQDGEPLSRYTDGTGRLGDYLALGLQLRL